MPCAPPTPAPLRRDPSSPRVRRPQAGPVHIQGRRDQRAQHRRRLTSSDLTETHERFDALAESDPDALRAEAQTLATRLYDVTPVLEEYYSLDLDPADVDALPEPEDQWRFHRDMKEALGR